MAADKTDYVNVCLCCEKEPIIGKPYSVYVCRECYLHGPLTDYDTVGRSLGHAKPCEGSDGR